MTEVYNAYQNNIHPLSGEIESSELACLVEQYTSAWVIAAIREAVNNSVRKLSYIKGILERWQSTGLNEPWLDKKMKVNKHAARGEPKMPRALAALMEDDCIDVGTG